MKFKLAYKLFGALLLILLLVVGATVLSRYLFARNFKEYIHQVEIERLNSLAPLLQEAYQDHNGWEDVENNIGYWLRRMRHGRELPGMPPPGVRQNDDRTKPHRPRPFGKRARYLLSDAQSRPIIGIPQPGDEPKLVEIKVDGRIVGWLGLTKIEPFRKGPPATFARQQLQFIYLLGGVVLTITVVTAILLTRHLLRPIKRLTEGTQAISDRDFSIRIEAASRDEFGLLAENFNSMAETLQAYEQLRRQWLSDISHELRTPLAVLRGEIESLLDGIRQPTMQNLKSLQSEIVHIGKLVEDLHLISMADSNNLKMNKQSLAPLGVLDIAADAFKSRLSQKQIQLDLHYAQLKGTRIHGDGDRLVQVFTNIFENACKYVHPPGRLSVIADADDRFVCIYFKDSGPGVPEESLSRLFDRLYRVDSSRGRDCGGSGLGLSICKHIVEHHGGIIWAENNADGGLTIAMQIPLEPSIGQIKE
jgi:two-component system sensor histidine kinase BaeS